MYKVEDNAIVPINVSQMLRFGKVIDNRVVKCEQIVAGYFEVSVHDLNTFYRDTEAKLMCCFVLHYVLQYSIGSIAKRYNINAGYLRKNITEYYKKCLLDKAFLRLVKGFESAVLMELTKTKQGVITT